MEPKTEAAPSLSALLNVFGRIGCLSFGGPAAQIALMHRELVETRNWLSERDFLSALSFCMLLPGPEAMQLATYAGWRLRGWRGGVIAGALFVLPGAVVIMALALLYASFGTLDAVQTLFLGVKAAVIAIVLQALWRLSGKALTGPMAWGLAGAAFIALSILSLPYPLVIAGAAVLGALSLQKLADAPAAVGTATLPATLRTVAVWGALWAAPVVLAVVFAPDSLLAEIGVFYSKLAVLTFGGAYAVLAWLAQEAVNLRGWLPPGAMLDALGLAETTPGPLILVTQFVAALAGYADGGWTAALSAAAMGLWVTFIPCFLWIFAAAPWIHHIMAQPALSGALSGITAAVVGVIASLAVWFAAQVLWPEGPVSMANLSLPALGLTALGLVALFSGKLSVLGTLLVCTAGAALLAMFPAF